MSTFKFDVFKVRTNISPAWIASFELLHEAEEIARNNSVNQSDCAYRVSNKLGKTLAMYFMGDLMKDVENTKTYPTFRLPELPLESMQVGDCIRVPVEDWGMDQIKGIIGSKAPEGVRFHFRYIEHANHTLVRRIV